MVAHNQTGVFRLKIIKTKLLKGIAITHDVEKYLFSPGLSCLIHSYDHIPLTKLILPEFSSWYTYCTVKLAYYQTEHRINHDMSFVVQNQ